MISVPRRPARSLRHRRAWALGLVALAGAAPVPGQAPAEAPAATIRETLEISVVTVPLRVELDRADDAEPLRAEEVTVREGSEGRRVVSLVRLSETAGLPSAGLESTPETSERERIAQPPPVRIAIYVDVPMASAGGVAAATRRLADQADELVAAGTVEVVVADPAPETVLPPTRDPKALRRSLREISGRGGSASVVERIRRSVLAGEAGVTRHRDLLRARAAEEARFVAERRLRLSLWAAKTPSLGRPRFLFLVSGVYDSDPAKFYLDRLEAGGAPQGGGGSLVRQSITESMLLEVDLRALQQGQSESELGANLAALGWMTFPVAFADLGFETFGGADEPGHTRFVALGRGSTSALGGASAFLFADPLAGWSTVSAPTGGEVLGSERALRQAVRGLGDLYLLTYERAGVPAGEVRKLELATSRSGARLHSLARVGEATPEGAAALATGALLAGAAPETDLPLRVVVGRTAPSAEGDRVRLDLSVEVAALRSATGAELGRDLRLTVALPAPDGSVQILQQRLGAAPGESPWRFALEVRLPPATRQLALRLEDLATGLRGSLRVSLRGSEGPAESGQPPSN